MHGMPELTVDLLLAAYASGIFPMAESADDEDVFWVDPEQRGIIPLDRLHIPRRLARTIKQGRYEVSMDRDFAGVIDACAAATTDRPSTWINGTIRDLYVQMHERGHAHSVETWQDGTLVGGLYGIAINGAFFGESMFSRAPDASKVALVHLVNHLRARGFVLLDTQFVTEHLRQFGAIEIPRTEYRRRLQAALAKDVSFND